MEPSGTQTTARLSQRDAERLAEEDIRRAEHGGAVKQATEETDDLLADIDALLEDQEVLVRFRQKGGE
jgi:hypothetical protein